MIDFSANINILKNLKKNQELVIAKTTFLTTSFLQSKVLNTILKVYKLSEVN